MREFARMTGYACAGVLAIAMITPARADTRYTTEMKMGAGAMSGLVRTTKYYKEGRERDETSMKFGPIDMHTVAITLCDKAQTYKIDSDLKLYSVGPVSASGFATPGMSRQGGPGLPGAGGGQTEGKVVTTVTIKDLGEEKIGDMMTHHAQVTMHIVTSGCLGKSDITTNAETWTAPGKISVCPAFLAPTRTADNGSGCKITYEMHGDLDKMKDVMGGIMVRMKMSFGAMEMTQDMKDYSEAPLDDSLFVIPADYKQVSEADLAQAQQQAVRDKMAKQFGGGGGH